MAIKVGDWIYPYNSTSALTGGAAYNVEEIDDYGGIIVIDDLGDETYLSRDSYYTAQLEVKLLHEGATLPTKAHYSDAGWDIYAAETVWVKGPTLIPTGLAMAIPEGYYGRLKGRSGMTSKTPVRVQEGTIDSGYRGEVMVMADTIVDSRAIRYPAHYSLEHSHMVEKGDRIAQLIIQKLPDVELLQVDELDEDTARGTGGFGSTGGF